MSLFVDEQRGRFGVEPICKTLGVSVSAYYQRRSGQRSARAVEDERLLARIRELHASNYDAYGYRRMWKASALQAAAAGRVVVDLQEVTFLDSATLALLVQEHRRLQQAGGELTVLVGEQTPTTVFVVTGIDQILTIRPAAVTRMAGPSAR